jgi:hypothetical protein
MSDLSPQVGQCLRKMAENFYEFTLGIGVLDVYAAGRAAQDRGIAALLMLSNNLTDVGRGHGDPAASPPCSRLASSGANKIPKMDAACGIASPIRAWTWCPY